MHNSRSINVTPDQSIFSHLSKDNSLNTLTSIPSNPSLSKRFSSCRGAYTSFKSQQKKLKQISSLNPVQKLPINYVQEYTSRLAKPENLPTTHPASYYEEIQECLKILQMSEESKKPSYSKINRIKGLESITDALISLDTLLKTVTPKQISKSDWFNPNGRISCLKNFLYFQKILLEDLCKIADFISNLSESCKLIQASQNPADEIVEENKELKQRLKKLTKTKKSSTKLESELKALQVKERNWVICKLKMEEELNSLKSLFLQNEQVSEVRGCEDQTEIIQKKNEVIESLTGKLEGVKYKLIKSQYEAGVLKEKFEEKNEEIEKLENKLRKACMENLGLRDEICVAQSGNLVFMERLGMVIEELLMAQQSLQTQKSLKEELKTLQGKYEELSNPISSLAEEENVQVSLADLLFQLNVTSGEHTNTIYRHQNYQFVRPSYKELLNPSNSPTAYYTPPFKHWIYFTIRGIYDSKFYEHSLLQSYPNSRPSRFVDFVFSWLSTYGIDDNSRNVIELEWWKKSKADEIRYLFLLGLSPELSKTSWELSTFKEFLSENRCLDELSFYLHCRFLILQSPQMLTTAGKYSRVHIVHLQSVFSVLDKVFYKLPSSEMEKLKMVLSQKSKISKFVPTIDLSIVLRVALELFRQEKNLRYSMIRTLFEKVPKEVGGRISFFNFRNICKNLSSELNELEIVKFYRDCWSFSSGIINSEIFNVMGNENCIFFKLMKLPGVKSADEITSLGNSRIRSQNVRKILDVIEGFKAGDKEINMVKFGIDSMGVLELSEKFNRIHYLMVNYMTLPPEDLWIWTIEDLYQRYWSLIVACQSAFIESNSSDIKLLAYKLRKEQNNQFDINNIRKASERFVDILFAMNLNKIKSNIAARKIQQIWKMKANQNLGFISTVVKSVKKFKKIGKISGK